MQIFIECRHIMTTGRKCRAAALRGKPYCCHHARLHFRSSANGKAITSGSDFIGVDCRDLGDLRRATARALEALASPMVDTRRSGLLLYGLHLAASLNKRTSKSSRQPTIEKTDPTTDH